jgi:uncharacterized protein DUF4304
MPETQYARAMKEVVRELHPLLKERAFRKQRHTFNRECEPGVIQVINFQMGPYEVGDPVEIPGLRENLYGKFAVNLGVFIEELHDHFSHTPRPTFVAEYYCEIRRRLGEMMLGTGEYWWSLDHDTAAVADDVRQALVEYGFPFLDRLVSRDLIIRAWYRTGNSVGFPPRGDLAIALLHWHRGEKDVAAAAVRRYLAGDLQPGHREYVEKLVAPLGLYTT